MSNAKDAAATAATTATPAPKDAADPAKAGHPHQKIEKCAKCNKPITTTMVTALGQFWHPEHFTCTKCKKPITETTFKEQDSKPYCMDDFVKLFAKRCYGCDEMIMDNVLNAMGESWHYDCFKCKRCGQVIGMNQFFKKGGQPLCVTCENKRKSKGEKVKLK